MSIGTLDELISRLEDIRDEIGGDTEIAVALQPSYPLRATLFGVTTSDDVVPDEDESERTDTTDEKVVWLAVSEPRSYDATAEIWNAAY